MLQKAGPEQYLKIQKAFLRAFPEVSFCSSPFLSFVTVFFFPSVECLSLRLLKGTAAFCMELLGNPLGVISRRAQLPKLGVQYLPRAEACLVFHHLRTFLATNSNFPAPNRFFYALHAVHKMSCLIVCYSSSLG